MKSLRTVSAVILSLLIPVIAEPISRPTSMQPESDSAPGHWHACSRPDRSRPATAIVIDDRAYLIDFEPAPCVWPSRPL